MAGGEVDLHIHTTASSDGQHTPAEIFSMVVPLGLRAIAFADHNSVASLDEGMALSARTGIELIPCFELNTLHDSLDLHLLAYYIDYKEPAFLAWLDEIEEAKHRQAIMRLQALQGLGFAVDQGDIDREARGMVPSGATFLAALLARAEGKGDPRLHPYIDGDRSDSPSLNFYRDYFRSGRPAFVPLDVCSTAEGIRRIRGFGGVPVQAHPSDTGDDVIVSLIGEGLMGLEAYSSYHNREECAHFRRLAENHNLLITAGSDFHGKRIKPNVALACIEENSYDMVEGLKDARKRL